LTILTSFDCSFDQPWPVLIVVFLGGPVRPHRRGRAAAAGCHRPDDAPKSPLFTGSDPSKSPLFTGSK
jgi:hypothetical protein